MAAVDTKKTLEASAQNLASAISVCRTELRKRLDVYREVKRVIEAHPELAHQLNSISMLEGSLASLEAVQQFAPMEMGLEKLKQAITEVKRTKACLDAIEPLAQALEVLDRVFGTLQ